MKSYHKQLWQLTQEYDWSYTTFVKLSKDEVLGLLKEYQELKAAKLPQSQNNDT